MEKTKFKSLLFFFIAVLIGIILFEEANYEYTYRVETAYGDHAIYRLVLSMGNGQAGLNSLFFPVLAALPLGISYIREYKSGYLKLIFQRMSLSKYMISKLLKNALAGGIALVIPYYIYAIHLYFQLGDKSELMIEEGQTAVMFLPNLAAGNTLKYILVLSIFVFLAGVTFATFALGISAWIKNQFLTLAIPFALCIFVAIVTPDFKWDLLLLYSPNGYAEVSIGILAIMYISLVIVGVILFISGVIRNEKKE